MDYKYAPQQDVSTKDPPATEQLDNINERLIKLRTLLTVIGDRVEGGVPQVGAVTNEAPEPSHILWKINKIRNALGELEALTNRIDARL